MNIEQFCDRVNTTTWRKKVLKSSLTPEHLNRLGFLYSDFDFLKDFPKLQNLVKTEFQDVDLDQLPERKSFTVPNKFFLEKSAIEYIKDIPRFENFVSKMRIKYSIEPRQRLDEVKKIVDGDESFVKNALSLKQRLQIPKPVQYQLEALRRRADKNYEMTERKLRGAALKLELWEYKNYQKLNDDVKLFVFKETKFPSLFIALIQNYILYGVEGGGLGSFVRFRSPKVEWGIQVDTGEPCVEIRVYQGTEFKDARAAADEAVKMMNKEFPLEAPLRKGEHRNIVNLDKEIVNQSFGRLAYWYHLRLRRSPEEAIRRMEGLGFEKVSADHDDAKMRKRYENLFFK